MQTNAIPTSAPGDRAPTSEESALIKMTNQHTKLDQAMPVRTEASAHSLPEPRAALLPGLQYLALLKHGGGDTPAGERKRRATLKSYMLQEAGSVKRGKDQVVRAG